MAAGYRSSLEHLTDELARVDQLVRAQTERWRRSIASTKPDQAWGMAYVDDAEVGRYLTAPFRLASQDAPAEALAAPYRKAAQDRARDIAARRKATAGDVPLRLDLLVGRFGLDDAERDLLLLCLLPELDGRFRRLYGYLHNDVSRGFATVGLLDEMLAPPAFAARRLLGPGARLVGNELVVLGAWMAAEGPAQRTARVEDRVVDFLTDTDRADARLAGAVRDLDPPSPAPWRLPRSSCSRPSRRRPGPGSCSPAGTRGPGAAKRRRSARSCTFRSCSPPRRPPRKPTEHTSWPWPSGRRP